MDENDGVHRSKTGGDAIVASTSSSTLVESGKMENSVTAKNREASRGDGATNLTEHLLSIQEVATKYAVSIDTTDPAKSFGLTEIEAAKRLKENGPNALSPHKKRNAFLRYLDVLLGLFNVMLLVSGIASYILLAINFVGNFQNTYLGAILILVAFLNAGIEFYQQEKSAAILESFLNLIPSQCLVIREAHTHKINSKELVLGDLVVIRSGAKIPADLRIAGATDLQLDNSSLTGESDPQKRVVDGNGCSNPLEASNLAFNGALVVVGNGYGIVIRTGDHTVIGQIASLTATEDRRSSPMTTEIEHFVKIIAIIASIVAVVFFGVAIAVKGQSVSNALNFGIGTFVGFVPEGLPATVTMLLSIAAARMAKKQVLCKDLQGVETLGAVTLIATDKTGTLTRSQMTAAYIWTGLRVYFAQTLVPGSADAELCAPYDVEASDATREIAYAAALNTTAKFASTDGPISASQILGDATEAGLLRFAAAKLDDLEAIQAAFPKVFEIPFNSTNKWALSIHAKKHASGSLVLYLKGAPERVLALCDTFHDGDTAKPLTADFRTRFEDMYALFASKGHRALAFAYLPLLESAFPASFAFAKEPPNYPTHGLTFLGLVSLEDPPKHGVREAVGRAREAGIKVIMVTGDHPLTAEAIARKINIMIADTRRNVARKSGVAEADVPEEDVHAVVVSGDGIDALSEREWETLLRKEEVIFARTSPKQKLEIVKRAQGLGHIVGVTGDGVNDAPALKKADLGIAMNISGSDVSKEAAAMILIDDNFPSTISGIEEGRLIFQNLKKSIQYTLTHIMPEVWPNLLYIIVPLPLPLSPILILVVDLGFELCIALSYAYDVSENPEGLMKLMPRKPVTKESVARLKAQQDMLRRNYVPIGDAQSQEGTILMTRWSWFRYLLFRFFSKQFWLGLFAKTENEVLIDGDVVSYALLEAGTLQTVGCLVCYFFAMWWHSGVSPRDAVAHANEWGNPGNWYLSAGRNVTGATQLEALSYGQSAFYLALMFQQCFNHFVCKARLSYPVGDFMFRNWHSFLGVFIGSGLSLLIVYAPPLNLAFRTNWRLTPLVWVVALAFGIALYGYAFVRVAVKKRVAPAKYTEDVEGLQMFPTQWSAAAGVGA
ncbi:hypothetical protein BC830DRAFT_1099211 [Chytriomyces sp. MP71]|nr:hypothetical protein BC830DRAFT_1099211 [Chytriomyces sp. MP71]